MRPFYLRLGVLCLAGLGFLHCLAFNKGNILSLNANILVTCSLDAEVSMELGDSKTNDFRSGICRIPLEMAERHLGLILRYILFFRSNQDNTNLFF